MMPASTQRHPRPWVPLAPATEARKKRLGICPRYGCLNKVGSHKKYCPKHHHQALKNRDLISYIYSHRKQRAKARGHEWTLTLDNFRDWCLWTGYHLKTGRTAESASIDRRLNQYGYHVWNIACIPLGANAAKYTHAYGGEWSIGADTHYHYEPASAADAAYYAAAEASRQPVYLGGEPAPF